MRITDGLAALRAAQPGGTDGTRCEYTDCVYRILGTNGERKKTRQAAGPSPLFATGCGARVARQRCPILRAGKNNLLLTISLCNLSVGTRKAISAREQSSFHFPHVVATEAECRRVGCAHQFPTHRSNDNWWTQPTLRVYRGLLRVASGAALRKMTLSSPGP